jgi:hypothetical protein
MSRAVEVWLDDETDEALNLLCAGGTAEGAAIRSAIIKAAGHSRAHPLVSDPHLLERALDKSHDVIAEIQTTHRPPR